MTLEQFIEDKSNRTKEACPLLAEFQYCCGPGKLPKTMSTSSRTSFGGETSTRNSAHQTGSRTSISTGLCGFQRLATPTSELCKEEKTRPRARLEMLLLKILVRNGSMVEGSNLNPSPPKEYRDTLERWLCKNKMGLDLLRNDLDMSDVIVKLLRIFQSDSSYSHSASIPIRHHQGVLDTVHAAEAWRDIKSEEKCVKRTSGSSKTKSIGGVWSS
ncbi:hypothetical protein GQ600_1238 [Phytophthora cactorum]|nr:hypothetical protein GQ600_1238 [Phytophthora cactorum]